MSNLSNPKNYVEFEGKGGEHMKAQKKFPVNLMIREFKRMLEKAQSLPGFEPTLETLVIKLEIRFDHQEKGHVGAVHSLKMKGQI